MISLDKKSFNVIQTASNGVVNRETFFKFSQNDDVVSAEYTGGRVSKGFLVGRINGNELKFTYCQLQDNGVLDHGSSVCVIERSDNNKLRILENFEWRDDQKGQNIFQEL